MPKPSVYEDTNPKKLSDLLTQIHGKEAALPDFQRDFVWKPSQTQELVSSIANNFPAGSLLRIRNTQNLFALREFQGAPALNGVPQFLVLDGQQRLTSLYRAFYGAGEVRFFLDIQKLIDGKEFEEALFWEKVGSKREKSLQKNDIQRDEFIFPLSTLWGGGGYLTWLMNVAAPAASSFAHRQGELMAIYSDWIKTIEGYEFPVVTLSSSNSAEAVCTIFETLNRTGVKLTAFDLLTARFYPQGVKLRDLWQNAQAQQPIFEDYDLDAFQLLQVVVLLSRKTSSCKRSDVLDLKAAEIDFFWLSAVKAMSDALEILRQDCGILSSKWLPYTTMLVPFAASLGKTTKITGPALATRRQKVKRWFWCAVFGQSYEKAANSQSARDFTSLVKWIEGGQEPDTVSQFTWTTGDLRRVTPRQSGLYRGAMALVVAGKSLDFHSAAPLDAALLKVNNVDDHHIFPAAFLKTQHIATEQRDGILNRTLIDSTTNKKISDKKPSIYIDEMSITQGSTLNNILKSHLLPPNGDLIWTTNNFTDLLNWREQHIESLIQKVTS